MEWWEPIEEAVQRLARSAFALRAANSRDQVTDAWDHFLGDASRIFEKVGEIGRNYPERRAWCDAKRAERAAEPLLLYLHVARNQDHHGIAADAEDAGERVGIFAGREVVFGSDGTISSPDPLFPHQVRSIHQLRLVAVTDRRHPEPIHPPENFRGERVSRIPGWFGSAVFVRDMIEPSLMYFKGLLADAQRQPD